MCVRERERMIFWHATSMEYLRERNIVLIKICNHIGGENSNWLEVEEPVIHRLNLVKSQP